MNIHTPMIQEFVLEMARIAAVAVLPVAIVMLESNAIDWNAIVMIGIIAVLKGLDRALHETGTAKKGITRF